MTAATARARRPTPAREPVASRSSPAAHRRRSRRSARSRRARWQARARAGRAVPPQSSCLRIEITRSSCERSSRCGAGCCRRTTPEAWDRPAHALRVFLVVLRVSPSPDVEVPVLEPSLRLEHSSMRPVISRTSARPSDDLDVGRGERPAAAPRQQPQRAQPRASARASQRGDVDRPRHQSYDVGAGRHRIDLSVFLHRLTW